MEYSSLRGQLYSFDRRARFQCFGVNRTAFLRSLIIILVIGLLSACSGNGAGNGATNQLPVADAGVDQDVRIAEMVQLDGRASSDPDGDTLTYSWALHTRPVGSAATLDDSSSATPSFVIDIIGNYVAELTVSDGQLQSLPDSVRLITVNTAPVAEAGPDQTLSLNSVATLDGSGSTDADGDSLAYAWTMSAPVGSAAMLSDPMAVQPTFMIDVPGSFSAELIVNDGTDNSTPDSVTVDTLNSAPVANAGADQTVLVGELVQLDGGGSSDIDGDSLTFNWSLSQQPTTSAAALSNSLIVDPSFLADVSGEYQVNLTVNDGFADSSADIAIISTENSIPVAAAGADIMAIVGDTVMFDGSASVDADGDEITYLWSITTWPAGSAADLTGETLENPTLVPDAAGLYVLQLIVNDGIVASTPDAINLTASDDTDRDGLSNAEEAVLGTNPNLADTDGDGLNDGDEVNQHSTDPLDSDSDDDGLTDGDEVNVHVTDPNNADTDDDGLNDGDEIETYGTLPNNPDTDSDTYSDGDEITAASDPLDDTSFPDPTLPPDPSTVAPPNDPTVTTLLSKSIEFLYTGSNPIQTGVSADVIVPKRAAVIRGKVITHEGAVLSGVTISIADHPELGQTLSRADGMFDLVVNGGGPLVLDYRKAGYLPAQRRLEVEWQQWAYPPDVALVGLDPIVTTINLAALTDIAVASGSVETDADGERQARVLFRPGTTAEMVMADGSTQPLTTLNVRATEYTVGANGPESMPGELPQASGYTYAVELSVDEAMAADASSVQFSQGVPFYVDNFLGFAVGGVVPVGFYDRVSAQWIGAPNGRVLGVISITAGLANIDADGDDLADSPEQLAELGIDAAERQQMAALYTAGDTFWRVVLTHFTPLDCNFPYAPPADAQLPKEVKKAKATNEDTVVVPCTKNSSIIECQNQVLGEQIGLTGTSFTLNYRSNRVLGDQAIVLDIPVTGATVSPSLIFASVVVQVAGRVENPIFAAEPNQTFRFEWDGQDAYGRKVYGAPIVTVSVRYRYPLVYTAPQDQFESSWARVGNAVAEPVTRQSTTVVLEHTYSVPLRILDGRGSGLAGWTLGVHHFYDPIARTIYLGDGAERNANSVNRTIEASVGGLDTGENYDTFPIPALDAFVDLADGMEFGPDGSLYYISRGHRSVFKVDPEGIVHRIAGTGEYCNDLPVDCGAGGPALAASFNFLTDLAVAPDGTVYFLAEGDYVYAIGTDGIVRHVAGWDDRSCSGFTECALEGPATEVNMYPYGIDVGPDGALYVVDHGAALTIGRVDPAGIISTVVGTTSDGDWDAARNCALEGTLSIHACMHPLDVAVGPDGTIYVLDELLDDISSGGFSLDVTRVLAFGADGIMRVIFDERSIDPTLFFRPFRITVDQRGMLYLPDRNGTQSVYMIDPVTTQVVAIAGTGEQDACAPSCSPDGGPALDTPLKRALGVAAGPDGDVYVNDYTRIRRIGAAMPSYDEFGYRIASEDGTALFIFDYDGRHLRTLSALTGATMLEFGYNGNGRLSTVTDAVGKVTTIEWDGVDNPTAVVGPFGHRSVLAIDEAGYLASVTNPVGGKTSFGYQNGRLNQLVNASGGTSQYSYDSVGRLVTAQDPAGGVQTLIRSETEDSFSVRLISPGGRTNTYRVEQLPNEIVRRTNINSRGAETVIVHEPGGATTTTYPNGEIVVVQAGGTPRFGLQTQYASAETFTAPSSLQTKVTRTRTIAQSDPRDLFSMTSQLDQVDINGRVYTSELDVASLTYTSTSPEGMVSSEQYDALGRIVQKIAVAGVSAKAKTYGEFGLISRTTFGPQSLDFTYDASGNLVSKTNALGETTQFEYDAAKRTTALVLPSGRRYEYAYDALGNRTSVTMPSGAVHSLGYTVLAQDGTYLPPDSPAPLSSEYDDDRGYAATEYPSGQRVTYLRDAQGRAAGVTYPDAKISVTYLDATTDRVASMTRTPTGGGAAETLSFTFDGSIVTGYGMSGTANGSYSFGFNNNMFLTGITLDSDPEMPVLSNQDGAITGVGPFSIALNSIGMPGNITDGTMSVDLAFNTEAKLMQRTHNVDVAEVYDIALTYDAAGRITNKLETIGGVAHSYDYAYDVDGQLVEVKEDDIIVEAYAYDANGNRTLRAVRGSSEAATYDVQDRITGQGSVTYSVDVDGFLSERGADAFSYSARGELLTASIEGIGNIDYAYDALNRQIGRTGPDGTTQFLYGDPRNAVLVTEVRAPDGVLTKYFYDNAGLLYALQRGADRYYVASDPVGSPRVVVDSSGTVVKTIEYDAWGVILADSNPTFQLHVGFAGGMIDSETGLIRFGVRDYDPRSGRWTARDPILYQGGQANLYAYVDNDPINFRDPTGLWCMGASWYLGFGGGAEFCFDENGTSLCLQAGFGAGGAVPVIKGGGMKDLDHGGRDSIEGGFNIKCGPINIGAGLKLDDCGKLSVKCPIKVGSFGADTCAGMEIIYNDSWDWTGPTKEGVNGSGKNTVVKDAAQKWYSSLPDHTPPPDRKPSGTRVADPECKATANLKGTFCGRHKW